MKGVHVALTVAVVAAVASLATAQSFGDFFSAAAQSAGSGRSNTGPVLFPNTVPGSETSGVVVGASGFGFVPPGGRAGGARGAYHNLLPLGPGLGPGLQPGLGPGLGPGLRSPSLGPGFSPGLGLRLGPLGTLPGRPTTRLRPSVAYSTSHGGATAAAPLLSWRLPGGRSSSFLSGNSAAFGGAFSDDYI